MERRLLSLNIEYNFKWNQPYLSPGLNLSRRSNFLNSASGLLCKATKWKGLLLFQRKVTLICSCYLFKIRELQKITKELFVWCRHLPVEVEKQVDRIELYPNSETGDQGGIDPGDQGWVPHLPVQEASRRSRYFPCIFLFHQVFLPNIFLIKKHHQLTDRCYHYYLYLKW